MDLNELEKNYVFTTQIKVFPDKDEYIVLREPDIKEFNRIPAGKDVSEDAMFKTMAEIMPDCIVDSSFTKSDGTRAPVKEVAAILKKSASIYSRILNEWVLACPFSHQPEKSKN